MTFDLTPEQQQLVARALSAKTLPAQAMDAVLVVEELASKEPARGARLGFEGVGGKSNTTAEPATTGWTLKAQAASAAVNAMPTSFAKAPVLR